MALPESALSELFDAFRTGGDGVALTRDAVRLVMQELIESEATGVIGAEAHERAATRTNERNGHRDRLLSTKAGEVELRIPKLRRGSFFPSILEPRRRIDQAPYAVVMTAYVNGVSTRAVDDLVAALGVDTGISKSEVSRICKRLDEHVDAFRNRPVGHTSFPYVYLVATNVNVRDTALGQVVSKAIVIATGITAGGDRQILGPAVGDSESEACWGECCRSLRRRKLDGVRLVIYDAHEGLKAAIRKHFTGASWQRCRVHLARNLLPRVPKGPPGHGRRSVPDGVHASRPGRRHRGVGDTTKLLTKQFPRVAELMTSAKTDVLAFCPFPPEHWRKIWSNNPLERLNKEVKRRSNVVQIFPDEASVIRLVGAILAEQHNEWTTARHYLSEGSMAKLNLERETPSLSVGELINGQP